MGDKTGISWTDASWNPIRGCSRVSEGCRHCYAETMAARFSDPGQPYEGLAERKMHRRQGDFGVEVVALPRWTGEVRFVAEHLADPLKWKKPRRIFVNSMSDLFHEKLSNEQIAAVFGVMAACPQHTFQVLTKRARRMREWFEWVAREAAPYSGLPVYGDYVHQRQVCCRYAWMLPDSEERLKRGEVYGTHPSDAILEHQRGPWPLPNVWLGVSVENQAAADERIPELLRTPAEVLFLSCEPLLGPVDLTRVRAKLGASSYETGSCLEGDDGFGLNAPRERIDWVIAGCESGPGARSCEVDWLRSLRDQCAAADVPFFLKQAESTIAPGKANEHGEVIVAARRVIEAGPGSKRKPGGVIELPYLDGVQHAAFPEVSHEG